MSRARAAFWTITTVVAAGALVLISKLLVPPKTPAVTPQRIAREVVRLESELTKLQTELSRLQGDPATSTLADSLNIAEELLTAARVQLDTIKAADALEANSRIQRTRHKLLDPARRILKLTAKRLSPQP